MATTARSSRRTPCTGGEALALKGVSYGRQSRTADGSESRESQRETGRKTAATFGVELVAELIEPPSTGAYKDRGRSRPLFPELLEMIRTGAANVVIASKTDRLSRGGGPGWAPLFDAAEEAGLNLDRFILMPTGFMSEFEIGIRATMDREESKKKVEDQTALAERRATDGRPSGGGFRAYGIHRADKTRRNPDGSVAACPTCGSPDVDGICEPEAEVLRECVARYIAGEGSRVIARACNTAAAVAFLLGRPGRLTSQGKVWREGTVLNMLRSPHIAGLRSHQGEVVGEASWPAIIDRPTWERLKVRLGSNGGPSGPSSWKYLLPRLLRCSRCDGRLSGAPSYGRARYRCQKGIGKVNCGGLQIVANLVDDLVVDMLLYRLESPVMADALAGRRRITIDDDDTVNRIVALEKRMEAAALAYGKGEISIKDLSTARREIDDQLTGLRVRIARHENLATINDFLASEATLREKWDQLSLARKQAILAAVIDRIVVHPAEHRGNHHVDRKGVADRFEVIWRV